MYNFKFVVLATILNCCYFNLTLPSTSIAQVQPQNEFNLSSNDIIIIQKIFKKNNYVNDFSNLPKNNSSNSLKEYFNILKDREHDKWIKAYLYLLTIVPEMFVDKEIGC